MGLRVIDLETGSNFFKSKNVAHDWLDMRVPVWVRDIRFMSQAGVGPSDGQMTCIGVATAMVKCESMMCGADSAR